MKAGDRVVFISDDVLIFQKNKAYRVERVASSDVGDVYYQIEGIYFCTTGIHPLHLQFKDYFKTLKEVRRLKLEKLI